MLTSIGWGRSKGRWWCRRDPKCTNVCHHWDPTTLLWRPCRRRHTKNRRETWLRCSSIRCVRCGWSWACSWPSSRPKLEKYILKSMKYSIITTFKIEKIRFLLGFKLMSFIYILFHYSHSLRLNMFFKVSIFSLYFTLLNQQGQKATFNLHMPQIIDKSLQKNSGLITDETILGTNNFS